MKKTVNNLTRQLILEKKQTDPDKYREIVDTECPHHHGLPSFDKDGRCLGPNKCLECWQEALKYDI